MFCGPETLDGLRAAEASRCLKLSIRTPAGEIVDNFRYDVKGLTTVAIDVNVEPLELRQ